MWRAIFWDCDMQLLIVSLLIFSASAYLSLTWLPNRVKKILFVRLIKMAPRLNGVLNISSDGCSGGCSSCGACEQPAAAKKGNEQMKIIRIFPNSSTLN
jgi:hypothetical protein